MSGQILAILLMLSLLTLTPIWSLPSSQAAPGDFLFAIGGAYNFEYPSEVAVDASGNVYVLDAGKPRVQKFDSSGRFLTQWGSFGTGNGQFVAPSSIAVDGSGNVWVAEIGDFPTGTGNKRIQQFDSAGRYLAQFSISVSGLDPRIYPADMSIDGSGSFFIIDTQYERVLKFGSNGEFLKQWGSNGTGNSQFNNPQGVVAKGGSVYVADTDNHRIQKFSTDGEYIRQWGSSGFGNGQFSYPMDLAMNQNGELYVADTWNQRIQKFDSSGVYLGQWGIFQYGHGQYQEPSGVAVDQTTGNVYVADSSNRSVLKFDGNGGFLGHWESYGSGNGQLSSPGGAAVDSSGNIYVVDVENHRIQKFDSNGGYLTQWGSVGYGPGQFLRPGTVAVSGSGEVYVVDPNADMVKKFDSNGGYLTQFGGSGTGNGQFMGPGGVAVDAAGNVYVVDNGNDRIQKFSSSGDYITQWGSAGAGDGQFSDPVGVAVDGAGQVYVSDYGNNRIQKFSGSGEYLAQWGSLGSGNGQLDGPGSLAVDGSGNVYVADMDNNRIGVFTSNGLFVGSIAGNGDEASQFSRPAGVAVNVAGSTLYVVDYYNSRIKAFIGYGATHFAVSTPASATASTPFTFTLTALNAANNTATGFTGTVHFTSSDSGATLPADATLTNGIGTFQATLTTAGNQRITATDTKNASVTGTSNAVAIIAKGLPDLKINLDHKGNFRQGQVGAVYTLSVLNSGTGPTTGRVRVTDALPGGLSATAISGSGWECRLSTLTCTRSDTLAAGASFPPIKVTVTVAKKAPRWVVNTAKVWGGEEIKTCNNTAIDPTIIVKK